MAEIFFNKNGYGGIARKTYLNDVEGVTPNNWWPNEDVGHTDEAKKEVLKVFDGQSPFATPKPERLIQRVLTIASNPGDLVLDSFLGSGTTCAVAQKMGRQWIGIEMGEHAKTHCAVRLKKVVDGEQGGISKAVGWKGGGGFKYYELGEPMLDANGAISSGIDFDTLAAHIWWRETGAAWASGSADARDARPYQNAPGDIAAQAPGEVGSRVPRDRTTALGVSKGVAYALLYNGVLHDRSVSGDKEIYKNDLPMMTLYGGGNYVFSKHFLGPNRIPAFDGKKANGEGEEYECAKLIDQHPKVKYWLRNADSRAGSFRLPVSGGWFYPDFIGELVDGRLFVVEYKGDHLKTNADTVEKDAIGRLWAAKSEGKCRYRKVFKTNGGKDVYGQLDELFS